jgi:quercetin dioxygenase-like cupin family protein
MRRRWIAAASIVLGVVAVITTSQDRAPATTGHDEEFAVFAPTEIKWKAGPPTLPKGALIAVLEGDPAKAGPFVMRAKLPDGYKVPPHTHPATEHVTVISGTFYIGMGEKFDGDKSRAMPAGSFGYWGANMKHFAWVKGETIIQIHGTGPWSIKYVNPEDDPRNQK